MESKKMLLVKFNGNAQKVAIERSDAEAIFKLMAVYEIAGFVKKYVSEEYGNISGMGKRVVSNAQAKNVAEMALMLLLDGDYTDIEYAVKDIYTSRNCPCCANEEALAKPTYTVSFGTEKNVLSFEDMQAVEDLIIIAKLRDVLKRIKPEIKNAPRAICICKDALVLIRRGDFTDIEYALEEVIDREDTFDYYKCPHLKSYDKTMIISDDSYIRKTGLTGKKVKEILA